MNFDRINKINFSLSSPLLLCDKFVLPENNLLHGFGPTFTLITLSTVINLPKHHIFCVKCYSSSVSFSWTLLSRPHRAVTDLVRGSKRIRMILMIYVLSVFSLRLCAARQFV